MSFCPNRKRTLVDVSTRLPRTAAQGIAELTIRAGLIEWLGLEHILISKQLGLKRNSVTANLGWDYIEPNSHSYLNGAPVMPYGHKLSSGDFFAQPLLTSTMDLGAGNAYAVNVNGSPAQGVVVGTRYSFMDLKSEPTAESLN